MKKKLFSRGLYIEGLRQLRIIGFISLAIFMLVEVSIPVLNYIEYTSRADKSSISATAVAFLDMSPVVLIVPLVIAPIMVLSVFNWMNRRSSSDFYHSLPYTRFCILTSFIAAVFTWLIAITVISCTSGIVLCLCMPKLFVVSMAGGLDVMISVLAMTLIVVTSVTAAMSVTGTFLANITVSGLILFLPRIMMFIITYAINAMAPVVDGIETASIFQMRFNVYVNFLKSLFTGGYSYSNPLMNNLICDIYTIVISIVIGVVAAVLFCRRKSETAGQPAPGKRLQAAIRIAVAMLVCVVATCLLITGNLELGWAIVWYTFAIIIYFAYELITTKSWSQLPRAVPGLAVLLLLNLLVCGIVFGGTAIVHSYEPLPDELSAIRLNSTSSGYYYNDSINYYEYAEQKAGRIEITDKNAIESATAALSQSIKGSKDGTFYDDCGYGIANKNKINYYTISFVSKNGAVHNRQVAFVEDDFSIIVKALTNLDNYKSAFTEIPDEIERTVSCRSDANRSLLNLTDDDYSLILDSLRREVKNIGFENWYNALRGETVNSGIFQLVYTTESDMTKISVPVYNSTTPETFNLILTMLYDNSKALSDKVLDMIMNYEDSLDKYDYFDISLNGLQLEDNGDYIMWDCAIVFEKGVLSKEYLDAYKKLAADIKATDAKPVADRYLTASLYYNYEKDGSFSYAEHVLYLPIPEDFEAAAPYFSVRTMDKDTNEYIIKD